MDTLKDVPFGRRGQKLDLHCPPNVSGLKDGPPPLVVFVYGGAWGSGERSIYCLLAKRMSEELSAAVVCPDYCIYPTVRASPGRCHQQGRTGIMKSTSVLLELCSLPEGRWTSI